MASRTKQKEEARARRLAEEQARMARTQRTRRIQILGGVIVIAVIIVAVAVAVSSSGGGGSTAVSNPKQSGPIKAQVVSLLAGIPQSAATLGSPTAKVTVTEFGDLECPICRDFALGAENQLISKDVRAGKVKLVYRSLQTATQDPTVFATQQAAALAAGKQNKGWYYIDLFYHEQGAEGSGYVNPAYLQGIASQIPGLNISQWQSQRSTPALAAQVTADEQAAQAAGFSATPSIQIQGPKGAAKPIVGDTDYGSLESAISSVS